MEPELRLSGISYPPDREIIGRQNGGFKGESITSPEDSETKESKHSGGRCDLSKPLGKLVKLSIERANK